MDKSTHYSFRRSGFNSHNPHGGSQLSVIPVTGHPTFFFDSAGICHECGTYRQVEHPYAQNNKKRLLHGLSWLLWPGRTEASSTCGLSTYLVTRLSLTYTPSFGTPAVEAETGRSPLFCDPPSIGQ